MTTPAPDFIDVVDLVPERTGTERRPDDATWQESSTLPQRAFKLILDAGIAYYGQTDQQAAIRRALPFLEANELTIVKSLVANEPLKVIHGFPKRNAEMPVVAIILGKEDTAPDEKFINDYGDVGEDNYGDAGRENASIFSVGFDTVLRLIVYAENPDVTIFWYELVKFIFIQAREILTKLGIDIPLFNGHDIKIASKDEAELLYMREITLNFRTRQVFALEQGLITHLDMFIKDAFTAQRALSTGNSGVAQIGSEEPLAPTPEPDPTPGVLDDWSTRPRAAAGNALADGAVGIRQTADGPAPYIYLADHRDWVRSLWANQAGVVTLLGVAEGNRDPSLETPDFTVTEANGGTVLPVGGYLEVGSTGANSQAYLEATPAVGASILCFSGYVEVTAGVFTGVVDQDRACHVGMGVRSAPADYGISLNLSHNTDGLATLVTTADVPMGGAIGTNSRRDLRSGPKWVELYLPGNTSEYVELYIDHVLVQRALVSDISFIPLSPYGHVGDSSSGSSRTHRVRQVTISELAG